jgi:hypothetical protein
LLIAPYAANTLSLLAVGVIPLFQKRRLPGGLILVLNLSITFFNAPAYRETLGYISTFILIVTWAILLWSVLWDKQRLQHQLARVK